MSKRSKTSIFFLIFEMLWNIETTSAPDTPQFLNKRKYFSLDYFYIKNLQLLNCLQNRTFCIMEINRESSHQYITINLYIELVCIKLSHIDWKLSERTKQKYQWLMKRHKDGWFSYGAVREWGVGKNWC